MALSPMDRLAWSAATVVLSVLCAMGWDIYSTRTGKDHLARPGWLVALLLAAVVVGFLMG